MDDARKGFTDLSLPGIKGRPRMLLWVLLLTMTVLLILFPADLKYDLSIHTIPFLYIFHSFSLFAVIYYIWLAFLLALLFTSGGGCRIDCEKAALVGIFAVIFASYSTMVSHGFTGDAFTPAGDIKNLITQGHFSTPPALKYHGFPGFSLLGTGACLISGLDITDYMSFFPFFQILLFALLLYVFFNRLLKNPFLASLGALLVIQLDIPVSTTVSGFHAGAFAPFCLFPAALLLFTHDKVTAVRRWSRLEPAEWLIIIILITLYLSHFVTSVEAFLIILSIYILQKISGRQILSTALVLLLLLFPIIWNLVENMGIIRYFADMVPGAAANLMSGNIISEWLLPMETTSYIGARSYLWTTPPLYLGPLLLVVIGGILGLARLLKVKNLEKGELIALGGLAGTVLLALILLFLGGLQESYGRTLIYIALFTIPIILWRVYYLTTTRKYVIMLLVTVLFLLSLPAFLLNSKAIASSTYYPCEIASGEFLKSSYGNGSGLHVYGMEGSAYYLTYYLPNAYLDYAYPPQLRSRDIAYIWNVVNKYVTSIEEGNREEPAWATGDSIIMFSPKWDAPFRDYIGIDIKNSPEWHQLESRLSDNNLIYDNGFVRIYQRAK
jgi:hypothetical protein